jgi:hypothetical protein
VGAKLVGAREVHQDLTALEDVTVRDVVLVVLERFALELVQDPPGSDPTALVGARGMHCGKHRHRGESGQKHGRWQPEGHPGSPVERHHESKDDRFVTVCPRDLRQFGKQVAGRVSTTRRRGAWNRGANAL